METREKLLTQLNETNKKGSRNYSPNEHLGIVTLHIQEHLKGRKDTRFISQQNSI